jgi:hypothetical protein
MKNLLMTMTLFSLLGLQLNAFAQEVVEVTQAEKEQVAVSLETEAAKPKHSSKTRQLLQKVANIFKKSTTTDEVEVGKAKDCVDCQQVKQKSNIFKKIGRDLGKGSAWVTTKTSKPFMNAAGFLTGVFEKSDKNQDIVGLYKFFLNHQDEFDPLYLQAGTPEEMIELMIEKTEEIMANKTKIILKDLLPQIGITKEIPADLEDFELSDEELAQIDYSKVNSDLINKHPEYQELKPFLGSMTNDDLEEIIETGYFDKTISFDNLKGGLPRIHEAASTIVAQIFAPKIVLGVVSKSLAGLYAIPVLAADIGTGVSAAICLKAENQAKFEADQDLRAFCSYVTNKTGYELLKSRAKGYVAGKKLRASVEKKRAERKARRDARKAKAAARAA